jgi:pyruvate dehydrogenase E2 component (dihydrolipoamide acetyltransferase)
MSDWRFVASTTNGRPNDGKIHGFADIDMTSALAFIAQKRTAGIKLTVTTLFTAIIAPCNARNAGCKRFNAARTHSETRLFVCALYGYCRQYNKGNLVSLIMENADRLSIDELAGAFRAKLAAIRKTPPVPAAGFLRFIPLPFRAWLFVLARFLVYNIGIELSKLGLHSRRFGSVMLTNVGSVGVDAAFGSLMPAASIPAIFGLGALMDRPIAIQGNVEVRKVLTLTATMDHRIADGSHGGRLLHLIRHYAANPQLLETF